MKQCKQCKSFLEEEEFAKTGYKKANGEASRGNLCYTCDKYNRKATKILKGTDEVAKEALIIDLKNAINKIKSFGYNESEIHFPAKLLEIVNIKKEKTDCSYLNSLGLNRPDIKFTSIVPSGNDMSNIVEPTLVLPTVESISKASSEQMLTLNKDSESYVALKRTLNTGLLVLLTGSEINNVETLYKACVESISLIRPSTVILEAFRIASSNIEEAIDEAAFLGEAHADVFGFDITISEESPCLALNTILDTLRQLASPTHTLGTLSTTVKDKYSLSNAFGILTCISNNIDEIVLKAADTLLVDGVTWTYANHTDGS